MDHVVVQYVKLPLVVEVIGKSGERKLYQLKPAGKGKFGAYLAGLEKQLSKNIDQLIK